MNRRHHLVSYSGLLLVLLGVAACASSGPQAPMVSPQPAGLALGSAECFPVESLSGATMRSTEVVLFHRASVAAAVERHRDFFPTLGTTPAADPREVVSVVENAPRADRWHGYGYLYGFPDEAVDFFLRGGRARVSMNVGRPDRV